MLYDEQWQWMLLEYGCEHILIVWFQLYKDIVPFEKLP